MYQSYACWATRCTAAEGYAAISRTQAFLHFDFIINPVAKNRTCSLILPVHVKQHKPRSRISTRNERKTDHRVSSQEVLVVCSKKYRASPLGLFLHVVQQT